MTYLYLFTAAALVLSLANDQNKTLQALHIAGKRFTKILPSFLTMLVFVSILLYLIPNQMIITCLGGANKWMGLALGSVFGSLTLMPGFIAFPLSGLLLRQGVSYMAIAAFTTTLMMVGVLTFPVEQRYFGTKVALVRNAIGLGIALTVAVVVGIVYGEVV